MDRTMLRNDQWARIEQLLPGKKSDPGCTAKNNRRFVEAVLWVMRTGSPWRDLPTNSATGIGRLCVSPVGARKVCVSGWLPRCAAMPIWSTCSSTRPSCAPTSILPAPKKVGQQEIGRSRGGLTTK